MAAVVGDSEGPKTSYQLAEVAPRNEEKPILQLVEEYNNTIEVKILAPNDNLECEVGWSCNHSIFSHIINSGGIVPSQVPDSGRRCR